MRLLLVLLLTWSTGFAQVSSFELSANTKAKLLSSGKILLTQNSEIKLVDFQGKQLHSFKPSWNKINKSEIQDPLTIWIFNDRFGLIRLNQFLAVVQDVKWTDIGLDPPSNFTVDKEGSIWLFYGNTGVVRRLDGFNLRSQSSTIVFRLSPMNANRMTVKGDSLLLSDEKKIKAISIRSYKSSERANLLDGQFDAIALSGQVNEGEFSATIADEKFIFSHLKADHQILDYNSSYLLLKRANKLEIYSWD